MSLNEITCREEKHGGGENNIRIIIINTIFIEPIYSSPSVFNHLVMLNLLKPHGLLCPWNILGKNIGVGCHLTPGVLPDPGIEPMSPASSAL